MTAQTELESKAETHGQEAAKRAEKVDFKMITFSLAGKEYGVDIMNVKEIAKASRFTYVPNAAPFVRGVYNLRGEIISVLDLRIFFHLPAERKDEDALESLIILKIEEHVFGVIVDAIDKVVGISSASIQPPHPIFGDINVKYIRGIVENGGKLYIILDVEKIFAPERAEEAGTAAAEPAAGIRAREAESQAAMAAAASTGDVSASFVKETLASFRGFYVTSLNEAWFDARFAEWKAMRKGEDLQLREASEADEFLEGFWSPCTGALWDDDYCAAVEKALPPDRGQEHQRLEPGLRQGLRDLGPRLRPAQALPRNPDQDLGERLGPARDLHGAQHGLPRELARLLCAHSLAKGRNGLVFIQAVRDSIFFEFHDVLNANTLPPLDLVLCRDMLSFVAPIDQMRLLGDFQRQAQAERHRALRGQRAPRRGLGRGWLGAGAGIPQGLAKLTRRTP